MQQVRIANLEQSLKRIEQGYDAVLAENEKLVHMNDQTLRILAEGEWKCMD